MNPKRRTGYGVFDISREIARRVQKEWEMVESPARPPRLTPLMIPLPRPDPALPKGEKRPLAA